MITLPQFQKLFTHAVQMPDTYNTLIAEMYNNDIIGKTREAMFLAQLAHESCGFRYIKELGSQAYFKKMYDITGNRPQVARSLGNLVPGDGAKYCGRGWIQLTGKTNYRKYSSVLDIDLLDKPEIAGQASVAAKVATTYWCLNYLNSLADSGNFKQITRKINGGLNGYQDRLNWLHKLLIVK